MKSIALALLTGVFASCPITLSAIAQPVEPVAVLPDRDTPGESSRLLDEVRVQIVRGRAQLDANQIASIETLRAASQKSLGSLVALAGPQVISISPEEIPTVGFQAATARQVAEAHLWWGKAAEQFGRRDESLTAFARAARFAGLPRGGSNTVARDALLSLDGALRGGLPLVVPDDALEAIASIAHGKLWAPRRFSVEFFDANFSARREERGTSLQSGRGLQKREFLITSGRLYPPVPTTAVDASGVLSRVPPLYRRVNDDALPDVLRHDRMIAGYELETDGANKGLWRQVVRTFYASSYLTKDRRDDRPRAEALCAQFLKARALFKAATGLENPYARDGVTTLWLAEVSSWWPRDDDDPEVRAAMGAVMPRINTPSGKGPIQNREIETPPTSYPWRAAAQTDSAPGEIMFFKMTEKRDEAEWLREIFHEYGHVALPAINGFKPPLEPYGNGVMGETLGALWAASMTSTWNGDAPSAWELPSGFNADGGSGAAIDGALNSHVTRQAWPSLRFWKKQGPNSPLRRDSGRQGLQYLQGLSVYIERVYGAPVLGAACKPLIAKSVGAPNALARQSALTTDSLLTSFANMLRDPFGKGGLSAGGAGALPIWLGGALESTGSTMDDMVERAPLKLKAGERASGWIYVPPTAGVLRIEWQSGAGALGVPPTLQIEGGWRLLEPSAIASGASNALLVDVKSRPGWQRIGLLAGGDVAITAALFQKTIP